MARRRPRAVGIGDGAAEACDDRYKTLMEAYPDHTVLSLTVPEDGEHPDQSKIDPNAREYGSAEFGNVVRSRPQFLLPFLRQGLVAVCRACAISHPMAHVRVHGLLQRH